MELNVYQKKAMETCMPESRNDAYMLHGLNEEVGDIIWMVAGFCSVRGWTLDEIGCGNLDKLAARKEAGTIVGNGDGITKEERL